MFHTKTPANERRQALHEGLSSGRLMRFPGAFNPLSALLVERLGFEGVYVSGAALSASLALPDIGLTTLPEVAARSYEIARTTGLPTLVDADTGFGEPLNIARTVNVLEDLGLSGCHIEDQVNPKRCGHLDGKEIVTATEARRRIKAAVGARRDPGFAICARIERAKSYLDEGADIVFPDALEGASELEKFKEAVNAPVLANMTEFGKTELLDVRTLASIGVNIVIYPVTLLRLAMGAAERGLRALASEGTQKGLLGQMQSRAELYELLGYDDYTAFDASLGEI
jgi:methylisocitrate lyase